MKKVLIISYSFPPNNDIASRRYATMLPFFPEYGWKPYVLTTNSDGDLTVDINDDQVFRVGKNTGDNLRNGTSISLKSLIKNFRKKLGFLFRVFNYSFFSWSNQALKSEELIKKLADEKFDVILASYGPSSALRIGDYLRKILKIPVIYDFRDLGALYENESFRQNIIAKTIDRTFERRIVSKAKALITVSSGLAERLRTTYKKDVCVVYNGWSKLFFESKEKTYDLPSKDNYIYYAGRFYEHQMDAISLLIRSLKRTKFDLVIRSLGPIYLENKIRDYAKKQGVNAQVKILSKVAADTVHHESKYASVNLVLESMKTRYRSQRGVLTGKFMQLLTYKAPILAIAREDSEIGDILRATKKGALVSKGGELEIFFNNYESYRTNKNTSGLILKYSKEQQAKKLASRLHELVRTEFD